METDVKYMSSKKSERLARPSELHLSSVERSSRFNNGTVYSPVTELSMNLGDLSTDTGVSGFTFIKPIDPPRLDETPKRKPSILSPTPLKPVLQKQLSFDSGTSEESPAAASNGSKSKFGTLLKDSNSSEGSYKRSECRSSAYARFKAMPSPFCGFGSSPSITCPPESIEDKENASPAKSFFRNADRVHCSSPLAETKTSFVVGSDDTNSQDSGVGLESSKSLDGFKFPIAPAPRRHRIFSDDAVNSPLKYSPVKDSPTFKGKLVSLMSPSPSPKSSSHRLSPIKLRRSSLTSSPENDEGDEGFLDLKEAENDEELASGAPSGLDKLINAPVLNTSIPVESNAEAEETPGKHRCVRKLQHQLDDSFEIKSTGIRRGLFRSPSDPIGGLHKSKSFACSPSPSLISSGSVFSPVCCSPMFTLNKKPMSPRSGASKRSEPCTEEEFTPLRVCKRRKSVIETPKEEPSVKCRLRRSHSEAEIKHAVNQASCQPDLIGDCSKEYCLPTVKGCHPDLKSISHETVAKLLDGEFEDVVEKYVIIDARYPYEYEGGHIRGAKNIYQKEVLMKTFLKNSEHKDYVCKDSSKRQILIFHCEFSQHRGPNMCRFLRDQDRRASSYPSLHYPELYVLDKGYKDFYHNQQTLCEPIRYTPMQHPDHTDDYKKFRAKSKSWAGEQRKGLRTGLKF